MFAPYDGKLKAFVLTFLWARATAKDCLESSYFKEKPLREFQILRWISVYFFCVVKSNLSAPLFFLLSVWTGADADVPPPPKQAGRSSGGEPLQEEQSLMMTRDEDAPLVAGGLGLFTQK